MTKSALRAVLVLLVSPLAVMAQTASATPIAYFSPQRAFAASPEGKMTEARLAALEVERGRELDARNQKLKVLQAALQNGAVLSATARQEREREVDRFEIDIRRFIQDAQAEFLGVRQQSENAFVLKLQPALAAVAKARGLLMVVNEDVGLIAWADPVADITAEVVQRLSAAAAK